MMSLSPALRSRRPGARAAADVRFAVKSVLDLLAILAAPSLAVLLRTDAGSWDAIWPTVWPHVLWATLLMVPFKLIAYALLKVYTRCWSTVTFRDLATLLSMVTVAAVPATVVVVVVGPSLGVPRTVPALDALLTLCAMAGFRAWARYARERRSGSSLEPAARRRVLVVGAGEAGALAVRELLRHPETGMEPIGFVDDAPWKRGTRVASIPVLGRIDAIREIVRDHDVDEVLIAIPSEGGRIVRRVVDLIQDGAPGLRYKIVPGVYQVLSGSVGIQRIRDVDIADLLGRPPVRLDTDAILGYLAGKRVLITGAGGSIGSELVRQICRFLPAELILFGHGENSIYALERELDREWPHIRYHGVIGAIQNGDRLDYVFSRYRPEVVFHAAAHKHVPLMELNPEEAIFNNVVGSRNLVTMALKYRVSHFVNISTDKAVNPASVMGASKSMVEHLVRDAALRAGDDQVFVSVRFGNVLGSRGSVIPIFTSQIRAGGPVTVTHPDMVRYFMSIPEAAQLVLQASGSGRNGEIYILDMGQPVRIVDLARDLIRLSGLEPGVDIDVVFTGMRPGEKLSETLMNESERQASTTTHEKIFVTHIEPADHAHLMEVVDRLQMAARTSDHAAIRSTLEAFLGSCRFDRTPPPVAGVREEDVLF